MNFSNKVILITGASSGIGADAAKHFSSLGASLSLTGRNAVNLERTAQDCRGGPVLTIRADVTNEEDTRRIIQETIDHFGKLDVLVNNAGIHEFGTIETSSLDQFDRVFNCNVRSVYHLTMLSAPHLIKTKGCIINVSSACGIRAFPNALAYCMSKSAIDQFTKCVALELASKGVRVNSINPGAVITSIFERSGMTQETIDAYLERCKGICPLGRVGEVSDTSNAIAFLASEQSCYLTGVGLPVDGGRSLVCPR